MFSKKSKLSVLCLVFCMTLLNSNNIVCSMEEQQNNNNNIQNNINNEQIDPRLISNINNVKKQYNDCINTFDNVLKQLNVCISDCVKTIEDVIDMKKRIGHELNNNDNINSLMLILYQFKNEMGNTLKKISSINTVYVTSLKMSYYSLENNCNNKKYSEIPSNISNINNELSFISALVNNDVNKLKCNKDNLICDFKKIFIDAKKEIDHSSNIILMLRMLSPLLDRLLNNIQGINALTHYSAGIFES